jgi:hypothetical protein
LRRSSHETDGASRRSRTDRRRPKNNSVCDTDPGCTKLWRPLAPPATAGAGVRASLLGASTDGKVVTYNGHPLYFFRGGVWFVFTPKGILIKKIP